jgi:acetyl-CoA C-acetyltransferase/3-oxo-5,6-didehydrosuberyl-CoA/3-oxoadipyl-CoA thiolase
MEPVILSACRTPIGKHKGALSQIRPDDLLARVFSEAVSRAQIAPEHLDECFAGCANGAGEDNRNVARMSVLLAGLPYSVPAVTVNRLCASGLEAISQSARSIQTGDAELVLAGGVESMSRAPFFGWYLPNPKLAERFPLESMGETAENIAERYKISRVSQDQFALESHLKVVNAYQNRYFDAELLSLPELSKDESPRPDSSLEKLAKLKPVFRENGSVTAGNSSGLNDGAAALVLASSNYAQKNNLKPLGRILGAASAGLDPRFMGLGPVYSTQKLLKKLGLKIEQIDLIELNEAFAVQALAVIAELNLDPLKVNISGGSLALGHPLGCSGARIATTLLYNLKRTQKKLGLATLCVGVGQGLSMIVENHML